MATTLPTQQPHCTKQHATIANHRGRGLLQEIHMRRNITSARASTPRLQGRRTRSSQVSRFASTSAAVRPPETIPLWPGERQSRRPEAERLESATWRPTARLSWTVYWGRQKDLKSAKPADFKACAPVKTSELGEFLAKKENQVMLQKPSVGCSYLKRKYALPMSEGQSSRSPAL